jgi:hypothetical protein
MPYPLTYRLAVQDRRAARQALVQADKSLAALMKTKRDLEEQINEATVRQRVADKMFTEIERQIDMLLSNKTSTQKALMHNALQAMWRSQEKMDNPGADFLAMRNEFLETRHEFLMIHREVSRKGDIVFSDYDEDDHPIFHILDT